MKNIIITLLFIISQSVYAGVYKCKVDGKTVYQQSPCAGAGEEMNIKNNPGAAESGLRESEKKLLEEANKKSSDNTSKSNRRASGVKPTRSCKGIRVLSFKPYSDDTAYRTGDVGKNQCALVKLKLDLYDGRLRASVAEEIRSRFYARFIDEKTYIVRSFALIGDERVSPANPNYSARICFGESNYDIEQVGCR